MTTRQSNWGVGLATAAVAATLTLAPAQARAEGPVTVTGKGMVGGGLLGAEVVMIGIAIGGVKAWWPYVLFGAAGAGAGVAGGYAVESVTDADGPAEPALYMLAGGMALVVPTLVAVLNATAYEPEDEEEEGPEGSDLPGSDLPGSELPGVDVEAEVGGETGMIDVDAFRPRTRVRVMLPAVGVRHSYTDTEVAKYGVEQRTEIHIPVLSGTF